MIHVLGYKINGSLSYQNGDQFAELSLYIPADSGLGENDFDKIRKATSIADVLMDFGEEKETIGRYSLFGWLRVERDPYGGHTITWQTNRLTDVDDLKSRVEILLAENDMLKQENAEKDDALMELASIVSRLSEEKNGGE